jgi:RND family efflux transporter MFP subunit
MMMKIYSILIICLFFVACQQDVKEDVVPTDLAGKKEYLKQKQQELSSLEKEVKVLEEEIIKLDPTVKKKATLVTVDTIQLSDFERYTTLQGNIISDDLINASSSIGGRLLDVYVREGQPIRKGQLIAKVDLEAVEKQIGEIETSLELAQTVYERQKRLWDQDIGSEIQYLQAKNNKERLEKSLESIQLQLSKQNVYSPASGIVEREVRQAGEMTSAGGPILQILNTYKVKVVVDAPESFLGVVKRGQYVDISVPALEKEFKGKITQLGRTIDPANRTFKVEVALNNSRGEYKPNLLAEMLVKEFEQTEVIVLPLELIQREVSGDEYVYVVKDPTAEEWVTKKVYVQTGESYDNNIVVEDGLQTNDLVVVKGARQLLNNELITI